jgi:hypothetical protein
VYDRRRTAVISTADDKKSQRSPSAINLSRQFLPGEEMILSLATARKRRTRFKLSRLFIFCVTAETIAVLEFFVIPSTDWAQTLVFGPAVGVYRDIAQSPFYLSPTTIFIKDSFMNEEEGARHNAGKNCKAVGEKAIAGSRR